MEVDAAILGAGPAGSTLAALLAARGHRVALIDRDTFPRDKLCGEFLSYDALPIADALGVALDDAAHITHCRIADAYEFPLPHEARGISRRNLDAQLFHIAVGRGALRYDGFTATSLAPLTIERGGERIELRARVVAGAWGRWGRFDQQLGRAFVHDRTHRSFGFKRHYAGAAPRHTIELHSFAGGYLGVNAIEGGLTNICGLVHASHLAGHKGRWQAFIDELRRQSPALDALYARFTPAQDEFLSSEPVIFRARSAVERGVFMIGDASGIVDPLTGNGMAMAMQSALLAAPHLDAILRGGDRARHELAYASDHHAFFASRIRWSRQAARILSRPALLRAALRTRLPLGPLLTRKTRADRDAVRRRIDAWIE